MPRLTSIRLYVILLLLVMITVVTLFATAYEDPAPRRKNNTGTQLTFITRVNSSKALS